LNKNGEKGTISSNGGASAMNNLAPPSGLNRKEVTKKCFKSNVSTNSTRGIRVIEQVMKMLKLWKSLYITA